MDEGSLIEALSLTKVYGGKAAVDGIDFQVKPGMVTGFLGPNGASKSTTMRMILGLDRPTSGTVTVGGRSYQGKVWPLHEVGSLLDARAVHPGRSAYDHLHSLAAADGIARARVSEVLEQVGLTSVARKRAGTFSLGMLAHLLGTVCYMTAVGLIGLFTGVLVRSAAAAITSLFGLLLVLPVLADRITPDAVTRHTMPYLPLNLGDEMLHHHTGLSPGVAVAGLVAWVLVLAAAAAFSLRGRDA
jgi:ABC-type iron transport system FetAB ATPase subunit